MRADTQAAHLAAGVTSSALTLPVAGQTYSEVPSRLDGVPVRRRTPGHGRGPALGMEPPGDASIGPPGSLAHPQARMAVQAKPLSGVAGPTLLRVCPRLGPMMEPKVSRMDPENPPPARVAAEALPLLVTGFAIPSPGAGHRAVTMEKVWSMVE